MRIDKRLTVFLLAGLFVIGSAQFSSRTVTRFTKGTTATFVEKNMGTVGSTETLDWRLGNKQRATLDENLTFTFTDPVGPANLVLFLKQDGAGTNTVTWPASVKWAGGTAPTITSAASAEDLISCYYNGTNYYCAEVQNLQ